MAVIAAGREGEGEGEEGMVNMPDMPGGEEEGWGVDIALIPRRGTVAIRRRTLQGTAATPPPPLPPLLLMLMAGTPVRGLLLLVLRRPGRTMGMGCRVITLEEEEGGKVGRVGTRRIVGSTRTRDGSRGVTALIEWRDRATQGGWAGVGGTADRRKRNMEDFGTWEGGRYQRRERALIK